MARMQCCHCTLRAVREQPTVETNPVCEKQSAAAVDEHENWAELVRRKRPKKTELSGNGSGMVINLEVQHACLQETWLLWAWIDKVAVRFPPSSWKKRRNTSQCWNLKSRSDCQLDHIPEDPQQESAPNTKMEDMLSAESGATRVWKAELGVHMPPFSSILTRMSVPYPLWRSTPPFVVTQEGADTFSILVARDSKFGFSAATSCESRGLHAYAVSFLVDMLRHFGFRRVILSSHLSWAAVLPQGPPVGHHIAI